ncbi:aspartyl/glutamyl-tRNA amidotransferase subunit A [Candidatus Micrarchaeota archaeon]|jgi:aspartyl-tRNA(Asn)/glutamyl-tRNA(Gln) amidotransferase subunit A|nr:aspartyl/glutamyl-tRNA amidotransferase subunit A [Candidatus Micrarchaeota archaeon]
MSNLNNLTIAKALELIDKKEIQVSDIYQDLLNSIKEKNKELNIYLNTLPDPLKEVKKKTNLKLKGLPIAVKDNFCVPEMPTTASSKILKDFKSPYESTVTKNIKKAGGVIVGKTNLDAWAHGSSTETSDFGRTRNPRNTNHLPGGSSGGSAAAVAADLTLAAIGSETAGSVRQPAAWCGTVGFKPTYGRVSRYGVIAMASSTDSPGPITKTVEDSVILYQAIAGHDPNDATSSKKEVKNLIKELDQTIKNLKIGVLYLDVEELESIKDIYQEQLKVFEKLGAKVEFTQALDPRYAVGVYTVVQRSEVSSNLARFDGIRYGSDRSHFGDEAKRRIMLGTFTLSKGYADQYYNLAQKVRTLFINDFEKLFEKYDILVAPTSPGFAKKIGSSEGTAMFGELEDMLLEPSSIAGLPGISVPCYRDEKTNLYLGLNIMAPMFREDLMVRAADAFEKNTPWNSWRNNS